MPANRLYLPFTADGRRFDRLELALPSPRQAALLPAPGALYIGTDEGVARLPLGGTAGMDTQ